MKGELKIQVWKRGELIDETVDTHEFDLLQEDVGPNLVVNHGKTAMAHLLAGDTANRSVVSVATGTSSIPAAVTDTVITGAYYKVLTTISYPTELQVQFDWDLTTGENNGQSIYEFGLVTANSTLITRRVRASPIVKADDIAISGQWIISF